MFYRVNASDAVEVNAKLLFLLFDLTLSQSSLLWVELKFGGNQKICLVLSFNHGKSKLPSIYIKNFLFENLETRDF